MVSWNGNNATATPAIRHFLGMASYKEAKVFPVLYLKQKFLLDVVFFQINKIKKINKINGIVQIKVSRSNAIATHILNWIHLLESLQFMNIVGDDNIFGIIFNEILA